MKSRKIHKVVAVGDSYSGKTCMLYTYVNATYPYDKLHALLDRYVKDLSSSLTLELVDTAGCHKYETLRPLSYVNTNVFLLCYDVSRREDFSKLEASWIPELRHHCPNVPIILTATKIDLWETEENCVTTEEGEALAAKTRSHYAEISSLKGIGVDELIGKAVQLDKGDRLSNKEKENRSCSLV